MSAIKMPVRAYRGVDGTWYVSDDANSRLCRSLTEPQAKQIAIALNLHDDLVSASTRFLKAESDFTRKRTASVGERFYDAVSELDDAQMALKSILARAATANETKI